MTLSGVETTHVMQGMLLAASSLHITSDLYISISHSPKGWTDQELGELWMMKDFEPATAARIPPSLDS
jgi:hypothetical protein